MHPSERVVISQSFKKTMSDMQHLSLSYDCTVKTFGLLQPYFGHLSCVPVV